MADKKISQLTASTTPLAGTEVLPIVQSGSTVKVAVSDLTAGRAVSATDLALSTGNLTFSGTGQRILGDMSNGTIANRLVFQTTTVNGNTNIHIVPNGTSTTAGFKAETDPTFTSGSVLTMDINGGVSAQISSAIRGAGTYLPLLFATNGTEKMRISTAGDITAAVGNLVIGTATKGIDFSANANAPGMTSELLSWYEEGAWTPTLSFGGASVGIIYGTQTGKYTRIGNRVFFNLIIILTSQGSSTGGASISGLPFAAAEGVACSTLISNMSAVGTVPQSFANASAVDLYYQTTGANAQYTSGNFTNTAQLYISGCYRV